jgi:light-regulated signal transduction histidine kinase (bacteriophytochrome)
MNGEGRGVATQRIRPRRTGREEAAGDDGCVCLNADSLHDLVSPINQVCSMAELLLTKSKSALGEDAEVLVGFIRSSTNRLQSLLAGLRTYTQATASTGNWRRCDANLLLAGALAATQQAIEQSHAEVTHDPLPEVYCDPSQITYALASLIENSIKFRGERRPEIHISAASEKDVSTISVRDNGIGIDPRFGDRIFGVFKRIHNDEYPGAGMGLAIVRRIVQQHGGRIWVASELGRGATFFLALPTEEGLVEERPVERSRRKRAPQSRSLAVGSMERDVLT